MIVIRADAVGESVVAVEMETGLWNCSPEKFAEFFDATVVPSAISVLGGTQLIYTDWRSDDLMVRFYCAQWVVEQYFDSLFAVPQPINYSVDGLPDQPESDESADLVF